MRWENIALIKQVGKNGTNNEGLKKKPKFKRTYYIASSSMWCKTKLLYLWHFVYTSETKMVEKWWAITFEYFGNERLNGKLGKNSSWAKKGIVLCLRANQSLH
jgi:hypothetical protein